MFPAKPGHAPGVSYRLSLFADQLHKSRRASAIHGNVDLLIAEGTLERQLQAQMLHKTDLSGSDAQVDIPALELVLKARAKEHDLGRRVGDCHAITNRTALFLTQSH